MSENTIWYKASLINPNLSINWYFIKNTSNSLFLYNLLTQKKALYHSVYLYLYNRYKYINSMIPYTY